MNKKDIKNYSNKEAGELAGKVIKEYYGCNALSVKYVGGGSFGYAFKVEIPVTPYKLILKACRVSGMCQSEAKALKALGNDTLVHIPAVYFTYDASDKIPLDFLAEEFVEGTDCFTDFSKLFADKNKKEAFANKIADALGYWHSKTNNKFGSLENPEYDSWLDFYKPFAQDILETAVKMNSAGEISNKTLSVMKAAWNSFDYIFSEPIKEASLIHGDLNVMNVMADKNLSITAIIDPLECKWADKEFDLFQLRNLTGEFFNLYETYKSKFPVSAKCDLKCAFYAVYHEVYCFISSGTHTEFILRKAVKRLEKEMKKAGL